VADARARRIERLIVFWSVALAVSFGPFGIFLGRLLGGAPQGLLRVLELVSWFALYGLVMGLALALAWRVEETGSIRRPPPAPGDYWLAEWPLSPPSDDPVLIEATSELRRRPVDPA
jgi:hypothetical protein